MRNRTAVVDELLNLSRWLGAPEQDCAILGEGNASARVSENSFLVKASGTELGRLDAAELVEVDLSRALGMVRDDDISDEDVREMLIAAKIDPGQPALPSVETTVHAVCLSIEGVEFVGHSHPTAVNAFTCSRDFVEALRWRLFPDEIVVCGPEPLLVPYVDPGVKLARVLQRELSQFIERTGEAPKTIYLQNHGFVALGTSARQVKAVTAMAVKAARILAGTHAFGGPNPLGGLNVERIHTRPDEHYRQRVIESK